jgi:FixJ family two-component response regulator
MMDAEALVFVVDDDASLCASLQDLLGSVGLRVAAFASAQEFLRSPRPEVPSCLVLDVRLPGLSGLELQQQLASGDRALPIIFLTGHGDIPMSVQAMQAGAVEFLPKPFREQDLLDAIHQALARDRHAPETACLLLDVRLPGMDGLELQRQLEAVHWRLPIIFVTVYADDTVRAPLPPVQWPFCLNPAARRTSCMR